MGLKNSKKVFVVKHGDEWATKTANTKRVTKVFDTQQAAVVAGRTQAIHNGAELTIQNKHGQFREKNSYGNDPKNVKG